MSELEPGELIADRYKVLKKLGAGGMGSVYLVEEISTDKKFALKTILEASTSEKNLKRFEQESKATRLLDHPNLIRIHDSGLINNSQPFFVMDYCEGRNLSEIIEENGPLPVKQALDYFILICNGLTYAHAQGVVHRDLKPSNILISQDNVKVLDFGIAKVFREGEEFNTLTQTGEIFGSPLYMSPEQCLGKRVDLRSDVYSLGCMLFETLTGAPPLVGETALATMMKHQSETPSSLKQSTFGGSFPDDLENVVARMLAKNPSDRYQDLLRVADDLKHVSKGEPLASFAPEREKSPRNIALISVGAFAIVIALLVISFLPNQHGKDDNIARTVLSLAKKEDKFPAVQSMRVPTDEISNHRYFSTIDPRHPTVRDFKFPNESIGYFGFGENERSYQHMKGRYVNVKIPFRVNLIYQPSAVYGLRDDEVDAIVMKGFLVEDKDTDCLKNWQELTSVEFDGTEITDHAVNNLLGLKKLVQIGFNDTKVTAQAVLKFPLERMTLICVSHIKDAKQLLARLKNHKRLTKLEMAGDELTDEDVKTIAHIPMLTILDLRDNQITEAGLRQLIALKHLYHLRVNGETLTPKSVEIFKRMSVKALIVEHSRWNKMDVRQVEAELKSAKPGFQFELRSPINLGE